MMSWVEPRPILLRVSRKERFPAKSERADRELVSRREGTADGPVIGIEGFRHAVEREQTGSVQVGEELLLLRKRANKGREGQPVSAIEGIER
jgi:hypothetical protein